MKTIASFFFSTSVGPSFVPYPPNRSLYEVFQ